VGAKSGGVKGEGRRKDGGVKGGIEGRRSEVRESRAEE
jgi:hypothetical protein